MTASRGNGDKALSESNCAREIKALKQKVRRLQYMQKIDRLSENIANPALLFKTLLDLIIKSVNAEAGSILLVERRTGELVFRVARGGAGDVLVENEIVIREGIACWVAEHRKSQIVNDPDSDKRFNKTIDSEFSYKTRNIICVPMINKGRVVGVIEAINRKAGKKFTRTELSKLKDLAGRVAVSVENALLYEDIQRRIDESTTLYEISKAFVESLDVKSTLNTAMELLQRTMKVSRCGILLFQDSEKSSLEMTASRNLTMDEFDTIKKAVGDNASMYLDESPETAFVPSFDNKDGKREFFFLEPLMVDNRLYGVFVATRPQAYYFLPQRDDYKILYVISSLISQTLYIDETIKSLDRTRQFNEDILRTLTEGVLVLDDEGTIIAANDEGGSLLKMKREQLPGEDIRTVMPPSMTRVILDSLHSQCTFNTEVTGEISGNIRIFDISISSMTATDNDSCNTVVAYRDITEMKDMEEKARRSERLGALGEMAAGVAHEIRNPLQSIKGFVQLLQEDLSGAPEFLPIVSSEVDRLNDIVEGFLNFARPVRPKTNSVELKSFMEEIVLVLKRSLENEQQVEITLDSEELNVMVDRAQLKQVLLNLGRNGIQAMRDKEITNPQMKLSCSASGGMAQIKVEDNGCGISSENLRRLFNPFFTTKHDGSGLGLAISHRIVRENGGEISVNSKEGEGTEFFVTLPLYNE